MKCYSLKSFRYVTPPAYHPMVPGHAFSGYVNEHYPKAELGIELSPTDRCLVIGGEQRIPASEELLRLPPESGAIARDGTRITVYRASIEQRNGLPTLVPEHPEDAGGALIYIDLGTGPHGNLRFTPARIEQIVARVESNELGLHDEKVLAALKPFEPLIAVRSSKKYLLWGEERVRERLPISFDGQNIFYDIQRV